MCFIYRDRSRKYLRFQVLVGLLVAGCQCWNPPTVNLGRRAQYYLQQNDGAYQYGFDTAEGLYQTQEGDQANEVRGKFGAEGGELQYTAGVNGFVVTSHKKADAPATKTYVSRGPVRYATLEELATHPEQVDDTAEVKAAKASFQTAFNAAAAAAEAAPNTNIITGGAMPANAATYGASQSAFQSQASVPVTYSSSFSAPVDAYGRVVDTAEVKAAKTAFQTAYNAAAAAADAAPNTDIITTAIGSGGIPAVSVNTAAYRAPQTAYLSSASVANTNGDSPVSLDAYGRVEETAEVKAAKTAFQTAYNAAAAAAEAAPDIDIITGAAPAVAVNTATYSAPQTAYLAPAPVAIKYEGPSAPLDAYGRVEETAEVKAAKAVFQTAYNAAAAAAEAAADIDIITGAAPAEAVNTATYSAPQTAYLAPAPVAIKYEGPSAPLDAYGRVEETAEVKAAKAVFQTAYNAAAAAAEAAADIDIITGAAPAEAVNTATYSAPQTAYLAPAPVSIKYEGPSAPLDAYGRVEETAEVKAAKASFQAAYDAAAAAAEAAPDTGIITASNQGQAYSTASFPVSQTTYSASHGNMRTITFDGITLMQADGPTKFGYSYE